MSVFKDQNQTRLTNKTDILNGDSVYVAVCENEFRVVSRLVEAVVEYDQECDRYSAVNDEFTFALEFEEFLDDNEFPYWHYSFKMNNSGLDAFWAGLEDETKTT